MPRWLIADFIRWVIPLAIAVWLWKNFSSWIIGIAIAVLAVAVLYGYRKQLPWWLGGDRDSREDATRRLYEAVMGDDLGSAVQALLMGGDPDFAVAIATRFPETVRELAARTGHASTLAEAEKLAAIKRSQR